MSDGLTIAAAAARCGVPESTLRYWERIGLFAPVERDESSRHRRYSEAEVVLLETLSNLRAVGLSIEDMRAYVSRDRSHAETARQQRALFEAHAGRVASELDRMRARLQYLELKTDYWRALEHGDADKAEVIAGELEPLIRQVNPRPTPREHS